MKGEDSVLNDPKQTEKTKKKSCLISYKLFGYEGEAGKHIYETAGCII